MLRGYEHVCILKGNVHLSKYDHSRSREIVRYVFFQKARNLDQNIYRKLIDFEKKSPLILRTLNFFKSCKDQECNSLNHSCLPGTLHCSWSPAYASVIHSWLLQYSCLLDKHEADSCVAVHLFRATDHHDG